MLRRQRKIRTQVQRLVDAGLFALSFCLAYWLRAHPEIFGAPFLKLIGFFGGTVAIDPFQSYLWVLLLIVVFSLLTLEFHGFYNRPLLASRRQTAWQLLKTCTIVTVGVVLAMYFMKILLARAVVVLFGLISFFLVLAKEELVWRWMLTSAGQAHSKKRLILVGTPEDAGRVRQEMERNAHHGLEIMAQLNVNDTSVNRLVELLHEHSANGVILSATHTYFGRIEKVIQACELEGVEVWLLADFFKTEISQTTFDDFYGRPMLVFRSAPEESWQSVAKHAMDIVGAAILLVLFSLPMLAAAVAIRLTSPGPALFRQQRSGINGRPFRMLKFRSMVSDAEQRKQELAAFNEMQGPVFKVTDDPRVTPVGRFLRKYSIDEFPQLVNVLRGEMSLVGPRPLPVDEVNRFNDLAHRRRLSVKPGLTCLWQISGRSNVTDFKDWVRLDLEYIDNWSLWLDLKILVRTVPVLLLGTGAK